MATNRTSPTQAFKIIHLPLFGKLIAANDNNPPDSPLVVSMALPMPSKAAA